MDFFSYQFLRPLLSVAFEIAWPHVEEFGILYMEVRVYVTELKTFGHVANCCLVLCIQESWHDCTIVFLLGKVRVLITDLCNYFMRSCWQGCTLWTVNHIVRIKFFAYGFPMVLIPETNTHCCLEPSLTIHESLWFLLDCSNVIYNVLFINKFISYLRSSKG